MTRKIFTIVLCFALTAAISLFGGTKGSAQTSATIAGWNVTLQGQENNIFEYNFSQQVGDKISFVELLLPTAIQQGTSPSTNPSWPYTNIKIYLNSTIDMPYELKLAPTGDGSTGFGIGLTNYNVLIIKSDNAKRFPLGSFNLQITIINQTPPAGFQLGVATSVMLLKTGNGQVWGSNTIDLPAIVPIPPPPPPIGIDSEYISVEGHPEYLMELKKDPYGELTGICLLNADKTLVFDAGGTTPCCTTGGLFECNVGDHVITLNLNDVNNVPLYICVGDPTLGNCTPWQYTSKETEGKSGDSTCGWKLFYGRYAYVCF